MYKKKIIFIAGARESYPRNANALKILRENFEVKTITSDANNYLVRFASVTLKFLFSRKNVDAIYIGWMGHPLVMFSKLISTKPIIFDVFISLYDSICLERKSVKAHSLLGKLLFWIDKISCQLADQVIVDTETHREFFIETFELKPERVKVFYICADENLFKPMLVDKTDKFVLEFHGGFIPLQGVEYIIRAAKILEKQNNILFRFLGNGRDLKAAKKLSQNLNLNNIEFLDTFAPIEKVPRFINESDVALGIFGIAEKTRRVIPNKVYEAMACKKAVISADTTAIKELFTDGKDILLCKAGNPQNLADKIIELKAGSILRQSIAEAGYNTFKNVCDYSKRTKQLSNIVLEVTQ